MKDLNEFNITLFSASPRRKELLAGLGLEFNIGSSDIDESYPPGLSPNEIARYIANKKAQSYTHELRDRDIIITADTIVVVDDVIFGKPSDRDDAIAMLSTLSGRKHSVITGFSIRTAKKIVTKDVETIVTFRDLRQEEIEMYVDKFAPYDKAGSYGIQEWIGYIGIEKIEGSFYNVMGLPTQSIYNELVDIK